jgi:rhamnosyltransferase
MRARNDKPLIDATLTALARQRMSFRLIAFDNASTDGTREALLDAGAELHDVPAGTYVPGRVLNRAMEVSDSERVVFLNSDCTPQHADWLDRLLAGFVNDDIVAVFGRQVPRPEHRLLFAKDTETTYGDGSRQAAWRHCFSMASSAIRRAWWCHERFDESLGYSEDIEWTWRARQAGHRVSYVADAVVMHSHDYTLAQWYKRQYGEGRAEARIFAWEPWQASWFRYSLLPFGRQLCSDWVYCLRYGALSAVLHAPLLRAAQLLGRRAGFLTGLRERAMHEKTT